jgi:hypothetical protein
MSREVVPRPTLPHSLHRNGRFARGFVMRVLWVDPHNNAKILVRLVRIRTVVMLDEHEVFARERGYTGFDVRVALDGATRSGNGVTKRALPLAFKKIKSARA